MVNKSKRIALLADALVAEETAVLGLVLENIKMLEDSALPGKKKKECLEKMNVLLEDTVKHQKAFSVLLQAEGKTK